MENRNYYFMNEELSLININSNPVWFRIDSASNEVQKLELIGEDSQVINGNNILVKTFKGAELRYDNDFGKFQDKSNGHILLNCCDKEIPSELIISCQNI